MDKLSIEYKKELESLKVINLNEFIKRFKLLNSYDERETYLKKEIAKEILHILGEEEYLKSFYVDSQAEFIKNRFDLKDLDILKTLVYCYNTNSREFNEKAEEEKLKIKLEKEGFKEVKFLKWDLKNESEDNFKKRKEEYYKKLDGLKVVCVLDISKIGLLGSFDKKETIEGTLIYSDEKGFLFLLPKRCRTRGHIIKNKFYYKIRK